MILQLLCVIEHQNNQIEVLTSRVVELEARLNQNSKNSSQPPSRDIGRVNKPGIPKTPKNQGGQIGHKGNTLHKIDNPDAVVVLGTPVCECGSVLDISTGEVVQTYQEFDLPPTPKLYVTEYRRLEQRCGCGRVHLGALPAHIHANVQYGAGVRALTVLLSNSCQLSYEKISTLFHDLYGYDLNESTAVSNNECAYTRLEITEQEIKVALLQSEVVHFDESGIKVSSERHWLHTACNALRTFLFVNVGRGRAAHKGVILDTFKNWAVHDCYHTYFLFKDCLHSLCNSHLLRELQAQIEQGKLWATQMHKFLLDLYKKSEKGTKTVKDIESEKEKWRKLCEDALAVEELIFARKPPPKTNPSEKRGRKKRGAALSLLDRLLKHSDAILAFAEFEVVPFSNNQAERDIRPVKTKQKVAGCFRTIDGANRYARIQGFIATCRKQDFNVFKELRAVCSTHILYKAPFAC